jgi:aminoglycoside/choline kinase family phosphotransferase
MDDFEFENTQGITGYEIVTEIQTGGSDRKFFRVAKKGVTYILIRDENIAEYLAIQKHLRQAGVGVPEVLEIADDSALVEDLGIDSLYKHAITQSPGFEQLYQQAIEELVKLQVDAFRGAPVKRYYDKEHIEWEQGYFKEFFLEQFGQIPRDRTESCNADLEMIRDKLVERAKNMGTFLMHRDFQSQNIYVKDAKVRIIDFQSCRLGPPTYDLASLLRDPYVFLNDDVQEGLKDFYLSCLSARGVQVSKGQFESIYVLTALQRNMQALGAFANLSLNKGKIHFQNYIPRGLDLLLSMLENTSYGSLYDLAKGLRR